MTTAPRLLAPADWAELHQHARRLHDLHLRDLLTEAGRVERMTIEAVGLMADFSKQRLDAPAIDALFALADRAGLDQRRRALFAGEIVNPTENRPALHMALRGKAPNAAIGAEVASERGRISALATAQRGGQIHGASGQPIRHLVCLGIGGSDLGPRMVVDALAPAEGDPARRLDVRFVANVDPADLARELADLPAAETAFIVVSKTFTTRETLANATAGRAWLAAAGVPAEQTLAQFIGVTANPEAARRWGIAEDRILKFWDWVGGRYSLWSAVGISIAAALGAEGFDALLAGAAQMDEHFETVPLHRNLPVWMGLVSIWNRDGLGLPSQAVIPYAERLRLLPSFLQQLVMESNGKTARLDGRPSALPTAPIVWGVSGTNAQHSFFQQLHQGPDIVPVDFIVAARSNTALAVGDERQRILLANCLAQSAALALGKPLPDASQGESWARAFGGNRPSTTLVLPALSATSLGALIAAWEHATFVAGVVLGINSFDQFGVEYGKEMATSVEALLAGRGDPAGADASTRALVQRLAQSH